MRSDGVLESTLYIRLMTPDMFRRYTFVAENSVSVSTRDVTVTQSMITVISPIGTWLGSRVVSVLNSGAVEPGFKSQPRRCRITVSGKLFTSIVPLFNKQAWRKVMAAYRRVYDSRHLQADCQEPGSAPEPYAR